MKKQDHSKTQIIKIDITIKKIIKVGKNVENLRQKVLDTTKLEKQ